MKDDETIQEPSRTPLLLLLFRNSSKERRRMRRRREFITELKTWARIPLLHKICGWFRSDHYSFSGFVRRGFPDYEPLHTGALYLASYLKSHKFSSCSKLQFSFLHHCHIGAESCFSHRGGWKSDKRGKRSIWVDLVRGVIVALIVKFIQPCLLKMPWCRKLFKGDGGGTKHRTRN